MALLEQKSASSDDGDTRPSKGGLDAEETLMCPVKSNSQALTPASGKGDPVPPVGFRAPPGSVQCGQGQCQVQGYRRTSPRLVEGDEET